MLEEDVCLCVLLISIHSLLYRFLIFFSLPHSPLEPYIYADVTDIKDMHSIIVNNSIDTVVHFSAILSALGEKDVQKALAVS